MFGRNFRRGKRWQRDEQFNERRERMARFERGGPQRGDEGGPDRERGHNHHFDHRQHGPGRGFGREGFPFFGHHEGPGVHFAPRNQGRGGPPFHRGGPFGDDPFGGDRGGRQRQRRGDIKYILLELLAEQPRHGYDLIKELEQRYNGFYRPSPGSVYPTLQLLEDEGNLTSEVADGKRVYTITEAGRNVLAERNQQAEEQRGPWRGPFGRGKPGPELHELRDKIGALGASVMQVAQHGTPEQAKAAAAILDTARREIYAILARDPAAEQTPGE